MYNKIYEHYIPKKRNLIYFKIVVLQLFSVDWTHFSLTRIS